MIIENIISKMFYVNSLSLTPNDKWNAAVWFTSISKVEGLFTVLAMIALITAIILLFWVFSKYRHTENELNIRVTGLSVNNLKLRQEIKELTTTNEKLQQENAELSRENIVTLQSRVNNESATA